jgi:hypothetical protein
MTEHDSHVWVAPLNTAGEADGWQPVGSTVGPVTMVFGPKCAFCGFEIPPDGPSSDFCSEACQIRWTRREQRTAPLPADWGDVEFMFDGLRTAYGRFAEVFAEMAAEMAEQLAPMFSSLGTPIAGGSYVRVTNPDDPSIMERALLARRTRNTGPVTRNRPARNVGYEATAPAAAPPMGRRRSRS